MKAKGFSLIELLVVIAIIGILAAIAYASYESARIKSNDNNIISILLQMRSQAELQYDGDYDSVCDPTSSSGIMWRAAFDKSGATNVTMICRDTNGSYFAVPNETIQSDSNSFTDAWKASVKFLGDGWFCVDSSGSAVSSPNRSGYSANDMTC